MTGNRVRERERERERWAYTQQSVPGRDSNQGPLQWGQSLCTWDTHSTNWANGRLLVIILPASVRGKHWNPERTCSIELAAVNAGCWKADTKCALLAMQSLKNAMDSMNILRFIEQIMLCAVLALETLKNMEFVEKLNWCLNLFEVASEIYSAQRKWVHPLQKVIF